MAIKKDTLDQLLSGRDPKEVFSKDGLFDELKKALANRVLNAEMDDHLEGEATSGKVNRRNGYSAKTVIAETGTCAIYATTRWRTSARCAAVDPSASSSAASVCTRAQPLGESGCTSIRFATTDWT